MVWWEIVFMMVILKIPIVYLCAVVNEAYSHNHDAWTDVYLFGEAGLFGARRSADGAPAPILPGPHGAPVRRAPKAAPPVFARGKVER